VSVIHRGASGDSLYGLFALQGQLIVDFLRVVEHQCRGYGGELRR